MDDYIKCFSCGARSLNFEGDGHAYMLAAAGCYEMFNEVLEKEYSDFRYARAHHYTVDAYAVQHPGEPTNSKAVNSVGIHLISLYFLLKRGLPLEKAALVKMEFAAFNKSRKMVEPLTKPDAFEGLTIYDVWNNDDPAKHVELCQTWAEDAWEAWSAHHEVVSFWANEFIKEGKFH
ncbi:MAG: DUF5946 family protein [Bacteroidota bacterium]